MHVVDARECRAAITNSMEDALGRGAKVDVVDFPDPSQLDPQSLSDARETIERARKITDEALRSGQPNPNVLAADRSIAPAGILAWLALRKSAIALHPLYDAGFWEYMGNGVTVEDLHRPLPSGVTPPKMLEQLIGAAAAGRAVERYEAFLTTPRADAPLGFMRACLYAAAIRSRAAAASHLIAQQAMRWNRPVRITSLACGAARPVAQMTKALTERGMGIAALSLVDRDPLAVAAGRAVVERAASHVPVQVVLADLVDLSAMRAIDVLAALHREQQEVIEMLGFFEYLPDPLAVDLLRRARAALCSDGLIVFANMLSPRPEQDMFRDVIQWPAVIQRSVEQVLDLIEQAGFAPRSASIIIPEELVYQVVALDPAG